MATIKIQNKTMANGSKEMSKEQFLNVYSKVVKQDPMFSKDVVELADINSKHEADVYIVASFKEGEKCEQIRQGDIYLFRKGDNKTLDNVMFAKYADTIADVTPAKSMNLQLGESITGDHKIVPLKNTKVTISDCTIRVPIKSWGGSKTSPYNVKLVEATDSFCVVHREHGNITVPAGTYLACTQIDPRTVTRMRD